MMITLLEGLLLGFAYVMPIGAQNLFVIHSSITNNTLDSFKISSLVILMDISLAIACYLGIGLVVSRYPMFASILQVCGGLYLLKISISLLKSKSKLNLGSSKQTILAAFRSAFVLTWMNPQALIDGSILLGSFNSKYSSTSNYFIVGVCIASITWFYALTITMRVFRKKIDDKKFRTINIVCGLILLYLGLSLLFNFAMKAKVL